MKMLMFSFILENKSGKPEELSKSVLLYNGDCNSVVYRISLNYKNSAVSNKNQNVNRQSTPTLMEFNNFNRDS